MSIILYKKIINFITINCEYIIDFLFPPSCVICNNLNKNWLCENCYKKIEKHIKNKIIKTKKLEKMLYIFDYAELIRKLIIEYKFNDKSYISNFFIQSILNTKINCDILKEYDIIISVPLSKNRLKERGYNQTDLIAKKIAKSLNITYNSDVLLKIKDTNKQSTLNKEERKQNIKNAFKFNEKYNIENKKVILFDDIYTTGSTIEECCRILKNQNIESIMVLIIAKD